MARILIVDDSASMRQMVTFTPKGDGYDVVEALACAKMDSFNAIITDINMPNMDDITLIKGLRRLPNYRFAPILKLSTDFDLKNKKNPASATCNTP